MWRVMRRGIVIIAAAVCVGAAAPAAVAAPARTLTVMTYNIASAVESGNDLDPLADMIARQGADIVGLQEVDRSWSRSDSLDQARELSLRLGMSFRFDPTLDCAVEDNDRDGVCRYGTAILSRFSLRPAAGRDYRLPQLGGEEPRGLAEVGLNVRGRRLVVFNTHLSEVKAARQQQVRTILGVLAATRGPYILLGDLNARPNDAEIGWLRRRLTDAVRVKRIRRPTVGTTRLDYILVSRGVTVLSARIPSASALRLSDHRPVIARLRIDKT
jgi:endonuclease/exonuclease/phosphatase family metal-dependent hydrolase